MTFHPIDTNGFKPAEMQDQPQPMLIWADIDQMLDEARIKARQTGGSARQIVIDQVVAELTAAKDAAKANGD